MSGWCQTLGLGQGDDKQDSETFISLCHVSESQSGAGKMISRQVSVSDVISPKEKSGTKVRWERICLRAAGKASRRTSALYHVSVSRACGVTTFQEEGTAHGDMEAGRWAMTMSM